MDKNNTRAFLIAAIPLLIVRTVQADVVITSARAELSASQPRHLEVTFELRNETAHSLELLKAVCDRADRVELKQRSIGADNVARIWPVAKFEVAAGGTLRLRTDGRFFQVSGLDADVVTGQVLPLTLTFEDEPAVTVQLTVIPAR